MAGSDGSQGPKPPTRIPLDELQARRSRSARRPSSEPPPLAPSPASEPEIEGIEHISAPSLFDESSALDTEPTLRLRRMHMEELVAETGTLTREPQEEIPTPPATHLPGQGETDWPEPPELPEPPIQFQPPEMTMPPRMPNLPSEPPDEPFAPTGDGPDSAPLVGGEADETRDVSRGGAYGLAREIGTPELPEVTPSSLPNGLQHRLRESQGTADLGGLSRASRRQSGDLYSTVVSQVVDVPVGVMVPDAGLPQSPSEAPSFTTLDDAPPDSKASVDPVTSIWSAPPPDLATAMTSKPGPSEKQPAKSAPAGKGLIADRYRILERIGQGGMARIFRVEHVELGKDFALKIIHSALSDDTKIANMFYREARLASSMDHPNIVLLTDFGVDEQYGAFIVMEYLKGETLHARQRREGRLHPNVACEIALQAAEALHFIHQRDVVHCDIKSENVFLCTPPPQQRRKIIVKLLDFGLSHVNQPSGRVSLSEVGGTPAYMAPERINRLSPRPSMDIYSLGVLFYEMLTGTLPFQGTMEEVLVAQIQTPPEPPSQRLGEPLDDRLEELVLRALQKKPEDRQRDMGAFIYELRTVMDMLGIGRRRGGGRQAARSAASTGRVRNSELLVADCPVPLFMTDVQGTLVLANQSFSSFINLPVEKAAGTLLSETRLGRLCPEILEDFAQALATQKPTQRILSFPWRSKKHVSMMVWLTPEVLDRQVVGVIGVVHPFATTSRSEPKK